MEIALSRICSDYRPAIANLEFKIQNLKLQMDGVAIIDKPAGMTSHDVVARVRRILGVRRVGHTGTLDPFATGVLVLLVGRATRLAQFLSGADKEYEAVIRFGYATDTGDATGEPRQTPLISGPLEDCAATLGDREINAALRSLRGEIEQVPPMYSAKKVKGKKLYEFARRGEEIERSPVRVIVHEFESVRRGGRYCNITRMGRAISVCASSVRPEHMYARWRSLSVSVWAWRRISPAYGEPVRAASRLRGR